MKTLPIILIVLFALFVGCKKHVDEKIILLERVVNKITADNGFSLIDTTLYTYDNHKRISVVTSSAYLTAWQFSYDDQDKVVKVEEFMYEKSIDRYTFAGQSTFSYNTPTAITVKKVGQNPSAISRNYVMTLNGDKQPVQLQWSDGTTHKLSYDNRGNLSVNSLFYLTYPVTPIPTNDDIYTMIRPKIHFQMLRGI